jgi:hypothetical protein
VSACEYISSCYCRLQTCEPGLGLGLLGTVDKEILDMNWSFLKGTEFIHQETCDMLATILISATYCRDSREKSASGEGYL